MALSPIGGKIILEGEKEYKDALKSISSELKVNYSNMQMVTAACGAQEKSMETLKAKTEALRKVQESQTKQVELLRGRLEQAQKTEGTSAETINRYQTQLNNAQAALFKTTNELKGYEEEMAKASTGTASVGDVLDSVCDKLGIRLPEGARSAAEGLGNVSLQTAALVAGAAALVAGLAQVYEKLVAVTKEVAENAAEIGTMAQEYNLTAEQVQELAYAEEKLEVAQGTITGSMTKLTSKIADNAEAFKQLGVKTTDSNGQLRDTYDVYMDVLDALGKVQNQTEADALAQDLFGKSFASVKPLIDAGSKSIEGYSKAAKDSGLIMSNDTVKAMDRLYQKQVDVDAGWAALKNTVAVQFAPALESVDDMLIQDLQPVMKDMAEAIIPLFTSGLSGSVSILQAMESPILGIAAAMTALAGTLQSVLAVLNAVVQGFLILTGRQSSFDMTMFNNADRALTTSANLWNKANQSSIIGQIGRNANGTDNWRGGLTWVGENGPELVNLPAGSKIYNNRQSTAMAGATYNITIDASRVKEFNDIIRIAETEAMSIRQGVSNR